MEVAWEKVYQDNYIRCIPSFHNTLPIILQYDYESYGARFGFVPAVPRTPVMSLRCEGPLGAVRLLDRPSWLTADPRSSTPPAG